jgi:hypothetical protein
MHSAAALVITSISAPNPVLSACADGCREHGIDFLVMGDISSPDEFVLAGCDFWSIERQRAHDSRLARILPERHYARKNMGYLVAIARGAEVIIETDDDNFPRDDFWRERIPWQQAALADDCGWINIYRYFTGLSVWPRGYPLELVQRPVPPPDHFPIQEAFCPIQQGLADENPDVDAVYRLLLPLPVRFAVEPRIALGRGSWTPFNSQNTTWFKAAFPLLYLPSHCSFRMCDIWRSFVAARICWANEWRILFHGPTVWQERNEHNLLKDFADEMVGYLNNALICEMLAALDIRPGIDNLAENLMTCYRALISHDLVGAAELPLLEAWLEDIAAGTAGK